MEDILTSCVFGILRYLPVEEGLLPLLCRAEAVCGEPPQLSSAGSHAPIYEFWPTLSERCVRGEIEFACHPCEPDLLIKLHKVDGKRLYVLIEAKHLSGKSSGPSEDLTAPYDQLAREWDNLVCRCKKDEAEPLLIFLTADFNAPVEQIRESAAEYSRKRPHGRFACAWLSWRHIPSVFCAARESEPLQDLVKLCERMNLRFFDRRIHFESVPAINWHFQRRELQYDWLPASRVPIQWRFAS